MPNDNYIRIEFDSDDSYEDGVVFTYSKEAKQLTISVAEEKAMDSYNTTIECAAHISPEQILELITWLQLLPK